MDSLIENTRKLCREFEHDLSSSTKTDLRAFWRYVNNKLKTRPKLGDLEQEDCTQTKDDNKKPRLLNTFLSVSSPEKAMIVFPFWPKGW